MKAMISCLVVAVLMLFLSIADSAYATPAYAESMLVNAGDSIAQQKDSYNTSKSNDSTAQVRIGYELHFSDGSTTKLITRNNDVASIWIDGVQSSIATFSSNTVPSIQASTNVISEEVSVDFRKSYSDHSRERLKLKYLPFIAEVSLFDATQVDLNKSPGPTLISVTGDGTFRTCGTCGSQSVWITNGCTPCNGGWLCDKIKAPS